MASRLSLGGNPSRPNIVTAHTESPKPSRRGVGRVSSSNLSGSNLAGSGISEGDDDSDFFAELAKPSSSAKIATSQPDASMSEEEQLQMALALSQSEAESKSLSASTSTPTLPPKTDKVDKTEAATKLEKSGSGTLRKKEGKAAKETKDSKGSSKDKPHSKKKKSVDKSSLKASPSSSAAPAAAPQPTGDAAEAVSDYTAALVELDQGQLEKSSALLAKALEKLPKDPAVAQQLLPIQHEWAAYRLLIALSLEVTRLENERLWGQRALVAKFAALVATSGANFMVEHRLIALRMAINCNLEVGNFFTAAEFIRVMQGIPNLAQPDTEALAAKMDVARSHGTETVLPENATYDPNAGGVLVDGRRPLLCTKTMRLIRAPEFSQCSRCRAMFAPSAVASCPYCSGAVSTKKF